MVIPRLRPKTRRAWIYVALFAATFLVLDVLGEDEESRGMYFKAMLIAVGTIVGLLALCLLGYFAIEYIVAPIARSLAQ